MGSLSGCVACPSILVGENELVVNEGSSNVVVSPTAGSTVGETGLSKDGLGAPEGLWKMPPLNGGLLNGSLVGNEEEFSLGPSDVIVEGMRDGSRLDADDS